MRVATTGHGTPADHTKDMEYLAHLTAEGADIIDSSVFTSDDWRAVHIAHGRFIRALGLAYRRKWEIARSLKRTP